MLSVLRITQIFAVDTSYEHSGAGGPAEILSLFQPLATPSTDTDVTSETGIRKKTDRGHLQVSWVVARIKLDCI